MKNKSEPLFLPKYYKNIEAKIIIITIAIAIFGCIMVYSASSYSAQINQGNEYHFLIKQVIGVVLGTIAMLLMYFIDYRALKKFMWWAVVIAFIVLLLVFIPGIGVSNYGAQRWIGLPGFTVQASEIAKFCFVLFVAGYLSSRADVVHKFKTIIPVLVIGLLICLLILIEPNMSITMCVAMVMIIMLFVGGMRLKHLGLLAMPAVALVPLLILAEPYRLKRLMAFVNPWASPQGEGFQLIQSLYGLGAGGLFGVGLFESRQKYQFLPFSESDFIFSIIGEELGLLGAGLLMFAFLVLILNMLKVARRTSNRFGYLLVVGITSVLAIQVLINLAVVTGSIPPTGVPLPLISAGSSSIIVFMMAIGIVLNINRTNSKTQTYSLFKYK